MSTNPNFLIWERLDFFPFFYKHGPIRHIGVAKNNIYMIQPIIERGGRGGGRRGRTRKGRERKKKIREKE